MSNEKINISGKENFTNLMTPEVSKTSSGRVDINLLMARVRVKEQKVKKNNLIFFGLVAALILITVTILSF